MLRKNKFFFLLIFLTINTCCFCQIGLTDEQLKKNIFGKWYLVTDEVGDFVPPYKTKNDTTNIIFLNNGLCEGYLTDPDHKYKGLWSIKNSYLIINYNNKEIKYWFQESNDTSLILTTMRHFGSANRVFKRNSK